MGEATDRLFAGVDLLNAGKAPLIIFTRGQYPWTDLPPEGEQLAKRAISMGVQDTQILLTGIATNTADEAGEVKSVMDLGGMKRIILVTSAFHMPRARMLFERAGIDSVPYPTDFRSAGRKQLDELYTKRGRSGQDIGRGTGIHRADLLPGHILIQNLMVFGRHTESVYSENMSHAKKITDNQPLLDNLLTSWEASDASCLSIERMTLVRPSSQTSRR